MKLEIKNLDSGRNSFLFFRIREDLERKENNDIVDEKEGFEESRNSIQIEWSMVPTHRFPMAHR